MSPAVGSQSASAAPVRLARYLAAGGIASRRSCERLILAGGLTPGEGDGNGKKRFVYYEEDTT